MGCLTLVLRISSMNRVPHIGSHVWVPRISSQVKVLSPGSRLWIPGPRLRVPGKGPESRVPGHGWRVPLFHYANENKQTEHKEGYSCKVLFFISARTKMYYKKRRTAICLFDNSRT